ncbi:hypothetical protein [Natronorarus salvus]|uniref:hypothetical protein n=1 Tax=Natronorarus salvus TaxID=3117733 RepID=UPI002F265E5E
MKRRTMMTATGSLFALGLVANPVSARRLERGNWLSGVAEPVELEPEDITFHELNGLPYARIQHNIAAENDGYTTLVQREPNRIGGENHVDEEPDQFNDAWLGITEAHGEIQHKGTFQWYYEVDEDEWVSLEFEFDENGNLLSVNGVEPAE